MAVAEGLRLAALAAGIASIAKGLCGSRPSRSPDCTDLREEVQNPLRSCRLLQGGAICEDSRQLIYVMGRDANYGNVSPPEFF